MVKPDAERLAAWRGFSTGQARVADALDAALRGECELTLAWFELLDVLVNVGPMAIGQLSARLAVNGATVSRRLDKMQTGGLVQRLQDRHDARVITVTVTSQGRATYRRALPVWRRCLQREFSGALTDTDVAALLRIAAKLNPTVD